jgi:hypothetical protein
VDERIGSHVSTTDDVDKRIGSCSTTHCADNIIGWIGGNVVLINPKTLQILSTIIRLSARHPLYSA